MYNKFSKYLFDKYNDKVYKLPINIKATCPNRDGNLDLGGCIFCGSDGAGFESLPNYLSVKEQIEINKKNLAKRYKPKKYIAYFQNYSNTYLVLNDFKDYIKQACESDIVAIYISTRPDCVTEKHLEFLKKIKTEKMIDIVLELGLQTVNYKALNIMKRGHSLAEFIDTVLMAREFFIETCAHYIIDLPFDTVEDVIEGAKILSALKVNQVKCHSLYILKDTILHDLYCKGDISVIKLDDFIERIISFLENLSPKIVVQRLIGRAPKERTAFCNWDTSWWKIQDMIINEMVRKRTYQGKTFDYLGGKCILK